MRLKIKNNIIVGEKHRRRCTSICLDDTYIIQQWISIPSFFLRFALI